MSNKVALITGINGQDGSYLAELLLEKGLSVHGVIRRSSFPNTQRIDHIFDPENYTNIHYGDLADNSIVDLIYKIVPDEIYDLAAMSHVKISFDLPLYTFDINTLGPLRILEGIKEGIKQDILPKTIKYYRASSSEQFGITPPPQNENTVFAPCSPYGIAKTAAHYLTKLYREAYGIFACSGILFNHESPRRGVNFVTRKITRLATRIKLGMIDRLNLGNLNALRDWGFAGNYVQAMYLIMQHDVPDDWVVSTDEYHTVKEFVEEVFGYLDLDPWKYIVIEDRNKRPIEVPALLGDSTKIRTKLGWKPTVTFKELVRMMVDADLVEAKKELEMKNAKS